MLSQIKRHFKDFLIYGVSFGVNNLLGIILIPLYTKVFPPAEYGTIDVVVTLVTLLSVVGMLQLESSVARFYYTAKTDDAKRDLISNAVTIIFLCSITLVILVAIFSKQISVLMFGSQEQHLLLLLAVAKLPLINLVSLFSLALRYRKKPLAYTLLSVFQTTSVLGFILFFVLYKKVGIQGIFIGEFTGYGITLSLLLFYWRKYLGFKLKTPFTRDMLRFSLPLVPVVIISWGNTSLNRFIMLSHLSLKEIGIYSFALKIAGLITVSYAVIRMIWEPYFWEVFEKPHHKQIYKKAQTYASLATFAMIIAMTLFSHLLVKLLANERYMEGIKYIGVLAFSVGIKEIILRFSAIGAGITKKTEYNTIIFFIGTVLNLSLLFFTIPTYGLSAVPLCLLTGNTAILILSWVNSEKLYYIGFDYKIFSVGFVLCALVVFLHSKYF
ncbi:MAG: oligosaccharide flippase family protein [Bacteroidetes bacterium]|nr:oligosaccharide flippase family protein [Bacteroidota bacterium]